LAAANGKKKKGLNFRGKGEGETRLDRSKTILGGERGAMDRIRFFYQQGEKKGLRFLLHAKKGKRKKRGGSMRRERAED